MKVSIGPYINWVGPYQLADLLLYWNYIPGCLSGRVADYIIDKFRITSDRTHAIGEWLSNTWVNDLCVWVHARRKRHVKIRIDRYDTWGMDQTLALIILPMLKQLKETKHGSPHVAVDDVPAELRPTDVPNESNGYTDNTVHQRWDWAMGEMIWAFEQLVDDDNESQFFDHSEYNENDSFTEQLSKIKCDHDGLKAHQARIDRGLALFGKYFRGLWD